MNTEDYDVIEMDFPPYSADDFKLPDIEQEESFNANKNEIYQRNIDIAKEEQTLVARDKKAAEAALRTDLEGVHRRVAPAVRSKSDSDRKAVGLFTLFSIALIAVSVIIAGIDLDIGRSDPLEKADKQAFDAYRYCTYAAAENSDEEYEAAGFTIEGYGSEVYLGDIKADISEYRKNSNQISVSQNGHIYGSYSDGYGVDYILWSETPIPEEHRHIMTAKETKKIEKKEGLVIGCYPLLEEEEAEEEPIGAGLPIGQKYKELFDISYYLSNIESLENYPKEYEESGGKELAVTVDFHFENIKNDMGTYGLLPKVMCIDLGDSRYVRPFRGDSENFNKASDMIAIMFLVDSDFSLTYFMDEDELRSAKGIVQRTSECEFAEYKKMSVPNFKIAFYEGTQTVIDEYLEKYKNNEQLGEVSDTLGLTEAAAERETFEAADGETVYNSKTVSVKIEPSSYAAYTNEGFYLPEESNAEAKITIKNLTDIDYKIRPYKFGIEFDRDYYREITYSVSEYNEDFAEYDENGELLLSFDENNLCCFTVTAWGNDVYSHYYLKYDMPPSKKDEQDIDGFETKVQVESRYIETE